MALDREKTFSNAERLLKQGKIPQALDECRRLAEDAPKDLLMLNRLGDFLARSNRGADAIVYYKMIADQFSASGFYPKAIAILKKIVKVDPSQLESVVRLGELNLKQKLPGEARTWLLQAAEAYLRARDFVRARDVYEKLVAAEPDNLVHVVRLAEARAAGGDALRAGSELVALGGRMLAAGRVEEADRTYKRASELLPGRAEPFVGLARCHAAAGRRDEAIRIVDEALARREGAGAVAGEALLLFEELGDGGRAASLFADPKFDAIGDDAMEKAFRSALARGSVDDLWSRALPLFERWVRARFFDRGAQLLDRLARIEDGGHLRALEQLVELRKAEGNLQTAARAVERLVRAYQAKGLTAKALPHLESLNKFDPTSPLLFLGRSAVEPSAPPARSPEPPAEAPPPTGHETPAVPLGPGDEEFVSGNLTEAEVFEKYGLHREALQQIRQITTRFPGHVVAQEKLAGFLRTQADRGALRDTLVALAFAKRAAGDSEGARRAAREAAAVGGIESSMRTDLEKFALLPVPEPALAPAPAPVARPATPPPPPPPPPATPVETEADGDEMEILFDDADEAHAAAGSGEGDTLEEIEFYVSQGMGHDALNHIAEARAKGLRGAALDALEARARGASSPAADNALGIDEKLGEDDLQTIAAALEAEYGTDRAAGPTEPDAEQSVDEVFESFKEHVKAEVEAGDFRTHYDLGIAYKEMGLLDDALAEFRIASGTPELYREACSMLGICHWERGEVDAAIRWYEAALDAPGSEEAPLSGLRYDLADMLERTGDARRAFDLFVKVLAEEPGYRDVERRVSELRARLDS